MNETSRKDWIVLALVLVLGVALGMVQNRARGLGRVDAVSAGVTQAVLPITTTLSRWGDASTDFWGGVRDAQRLRRENSRLKGELAAVAHYSAVEERLLAELDHVRKLMELEAESKEKVYADIIAVAVFDNQFTINVGDEQGIKENQPVVTGEGLLGIVGAVGPKTSQVQLLRTPSIKLSGLLMAEPVKTSGLIHGSIGRRLVMTITGDTDVKPGTEVVTTGYSERIPRGIPIGYVLQVSKNEQFAEVRAEIMPYARMGEHQVVAVLK